MWPTHSGSADAGPLPVFSRPAAIIGFSVVATATDGSTLTLNTDKVNSDFAVFASRPKGGLCAPCPLASQPCPRVP